MGLSRTGDGAAYTAPQTQKAVSANFTSEQMLHFDIVERYSPVIADCIWRHHDAAGR